MVIQVMITTNSFADSDSLSATIEKVVVATAIRNTRASSITGLTLFGICPFINFIRPIPTSCLMWQTSSYFNSQFDQGFGFDINYSHFPEQPEQVKAVTAQVVENTQISTIAITIVIGRIDFIVGIVANRIVNFVIKNQQCLLQAGSHSGHQTSLDYCSGWAGNLSWLHSWAVDLLPNHCYHLDYTFLAIANLH